MTSAFSITCVSGAAIKECIPTLARLRISVFREFPYLYDGTEEYERRYLETYVRTDSSIAVLATVNGEVVGASTGLAMAAEEPAFTRPFVAAGLDIEEIYYCAESVLLPPYRGMGIYKHFFMERERHARTLNGIKMMAFCAVQRPDNHPLRPADYVPLEDIWARFGYKRQEELHTTFEWKDIDEETPSPKPMVFYTKRLQ